MTYFTLLLVSSVRLPHLSPPKHHLSNRIATMSHFRYNNPLIIRSIPKGTQMSRSQTKAQRMCCSPEVCAFFDLVAKASRAALFCNPGCTELLLGLLLSIHGISQLQMPDKVATNIRPQGKVFLGETILVSFEDYSKLI